MNISSIQLPVERALQAFLQASGAIPDGYSVHCAHDLDKLPDEGNFATINAGIGDWEEFIDNAQCRVEFRVATQLAEADLRLARMALHEKTVGIIHDLFSWDNFQEALAALNSQQTTVNGITIGFSGWEQINPPQDSNTETQIIGMLPYDFIVFIAAASS